MPLRVGAPRLEPQALRQVVAHAAVLGDRVAVDLEPDRLARRPGQRVARHLEHEPERLRLARRRERQAQAGEGQLVAAVAAGHHQLGEVELPLQRRLRRAQGALLEVARPVRELHALAADLDLELVKGPRLGVVPRLDPEHVVAARHLEHLGERRAEVVGVVEQAAAGVAREEAERLAVRGVAPEVLADGVSHQRAVAAEAGHVDRVDHRVRSGQAARHAPERVAQAAVAEAAEAVDFPELPAGHRLGRHPLLVPPLSDQHAGVEPRREVEDLLAPLDPAQPRRERLEALQQHAHLLHVELLVGVAHPHHERSRVAVGERLRRRALLDTLGRPQVGDREVCREPERIGDAREARHAECVDRREPATHGRR